MKTLIFKKAGFSLEVPDDWQATGAGCLPFSSVISSAPQIIAPNGATIYFAIGSMKHEPLSSQHRDALAMIAERHGHWVKEASEISILGKTHATIAYAIPTQDGHALAKNYHLIFNGIEYVATARIGFFVGKQKSIIADEEEYDKIIKTFKIL